MNSAFKLIVCTWIGTMLGTGVVACAAGVWVDYKVNEVSRSVERQVSRIIDAPANAVAGTWKAVQGAVDDFNTWGIEAAKEASFDQAVRTITAEAAQQLEAARRVRGVLASSVHVIREQRESM